MGAKLFELSAQRGKPRRRSAVREEFTWMRIKSENRWRQGKILRRLSETREHGLVPQVDAVEVADGQRNVIARSVGEGAEYLHV